MTCMKLVGNWKCQHPKGHTGRHGTIIHSELGEPYRWQCEAIHCKAASRDLGTEDPGREHRFHPECDPFLHRQCQCGCGYFPEGKNSRFLPGHDARRQKVATYRALNA